MQNEMSKRLDDLEETLIDEVQEDSRISSGTPKDASDGDLDFISMTGLTTPSSMETVAEASPTEPVEDMDPEAPVTFYEEGVEDVDGTMVPDDTVENLGDEEELVSSTISAGTKESSIEGLKEIIADLAGETDSAEESVEDPDELPETEMFTEPEIAVDSNESEISEEKLAELNLEATQSALENFEAANSVEEEITDALVETKLQVLPTLDDESDDFDDDSRDEEDIERDSTIYNRPLRSKPQTRNRRRRTPMGFVIQFSFILLLFILILAGVYYSLELYADRTLTSHQMMAKAESAMAGGEYAKAGILFDEILVRYPNDSLVGEAKFMSAYALQLVPDSDANADDYYSHSISQFERFLLEHPNHEKTNRAETLLGMLYYRTDNYDKTIALLGDPNRRMKDPGAYLTTLRTLARSFAASSRISESHSAFLRAATLDANMTPEQDYLELASLYVTLADRSTSPVMEERYQTLAIEQWDHAIEVPGILSFLKNEIQLSREAMIEGMALRTIATEEVAAEEVVTDEVITKEVVTKKGKYESLKEQAITGEVNQ
jgi:tetratricopeptide (TPR) repeat protein